LNLKKFLGSAIGLVILAGVSVHQLRQGGTDPRDVALMSGTAATGRAAVSEVEDAADKQSCDPSAPNGSADPDAEASCPDEPR
jgi:hypothetical protein